MTCSRLLCLSAGDYIIKTGDEIIVIAEDNDSYKPKEAPRMEAGKKPPKVLRDNRAEKMLICGWRRDIRDIFKLLDEVMLSRSRHLFRDIRKYSYL